MFNKNSKIYIAGHTGLLGSAILNILTKDNYTNIITKTHKELELTDKLSVEKFFEENKIDYVFLCAGKVGGIIGNKTNPATYLHENLLIQDNIFEMANKYAVKNVIFYGSSCTYPKVCPQPMKEEYWLTGAIEETSMGYAAAKIAGIIGCKSYNTQYNTNRFICVIPNSIYGPNDNFDLENSHVFSALIKKIDTAKQENQESLTLWGSGNPRREFIFSEDVANASIFLMQNSNKLENSHYNLGSGIDYSIKELAEVISNVVGYKGSIKWDIEKPDGTMQKLLDSSKFLKLGWKPKITFEEGLEKTYKWYKGNYA
ncbi:NAD-dependent epimerase/dehydratase [Arcobacter nitrofigilis DSM 7299]|uniref:GDP-L-fucose synthase n=1 Tax=Arcobacter nitrofigilis (strain ATCC 33309 / DSM 7299 / CCUG 15893 / LMG 7604 / NCTC 12251 / CI) TaxID=572480 RepID=D5V7F6_ARCNC|nr:GDP-L-fucose synthase [Arcobacter nitrofigilis]ADG94576.1 NAD-dependent epimerase/dehydratase [Arcobacter nitrofigilis DSM 7299]